MSLDQISELSLNHLDSDNEDQLKKYQEFQEFIEEKDDFVTNKSNPIKNTKSARKLRLQIKNNKSINP